MKYERLDTLLKKFHNGLFSDDEIHELNSFLKADNGKSFKKYLTDDLNSSPDKIEEKISTELWDRISSSLIHGQARKPIQKITYIYRSLYAAATLGFLIFILNFYFNKPMQNNDLLVRINNSQDTISNITLPDGSNVRLHPSSEISFMSNKNSRSLKLVGKATFDVVKNTYKPFEVLTRYSNTKVLGTVFTIDTKSDSLESVYLHEGKIEYLYRNQQDSLILLTLQSGGQVSYNKFKNIVSSTVHKPNVVYDKNASIIELNMADIRDVAEIIKVWYGVDLKINTKIDDKIVHRINIKEMNLDEVINDINLISNYKIEKYGNIYEIKQK